MSERERAFVVIGSVISAWLGTLAATNAGTTVVLQFWTTVLFLIVGIVFWLETA